MTDKRLDRLMPGLTAKERAILVMESMRIGEKPDPLVLHTTPSHDAKEFSRLLGLINAVNVELAVTLVIMREQARQTSIKMGWLQSLRICALDFTLLGAYIGLDTKEPTTESRLQARRSELAGEIDDLDTVIEHYLLAGPWAPDDLDEDGDPTSEAWDNRWDEIEAVMEEAIASGALPCKRRGKRRKVTWGDVAAWSGADVPLFPDWGMAYDVHPDSDEDDVARRLRWREHAERALSDTPARQTLPIPAKELDIFDLTQEPALKNLPTMLVIAVRQEVLARASELAAIEEVIKQIADVEFDGHDPLDDSGRFILAEAREMIEGVMRELGEYVADLAMPEAAPPDVELIWAMVRKAAA